MKDITAEYVVNQFLHSWQKKDWEAMVTFSQLTWQLTESEPLNAIENFFDGRHLKKFNIIHIREISECFFQYTIDLHIQYNKERKLAIETIVMNCIKEIDAYTADNEGIWGINPISAMKVIRRNNNGK